MDVLRIYFPWFEQLSARAGSTNGLKAENLLARKILMNDTTLATLLYEFHPTSVLFSATVKRLVRAGVSMSVEKDQIAKFYWKKLPFLSLGEGALPATWELFLA